MATTVKQFIDRSVPLEPVKNKIDKEFATAIQQKYMYFDPERSAPKGPSQDLVYFVDQKKWQPRVDVQVDILKLFGNYAFRGMNSKSTIGFINVGLPEFGRHVRIFLRPVPGTGGGGLKNEQKLIDEINNYINPGASIAVEFKTPTGRKFRIDDVVDAESVGQKGQGTRNVLVPKSDVDLRTGDGGRVPISIKQKDAAFWGGMESWFYPDGKWGFGADSYMKAAVKNKDLDLTIKKIAPNVNHFYTNKGLTKKGAALLCPPNLKKIVVFGSDILRYNGAVVKRTFSKDDFSWVQDKEGTQILQIKADDIIRDMRDMKEECFVLFMNTGGPQEKIDGEILPGRGVNSKVAVGVRVIASIPARARSTVRFRDTGMKDKEKLPILKKY